MQATQQALIGFVDDAIGKVFAPKTITGKNGASVGTSVTMRSRKDIAEALNLKGKNNKDALDIAILEQSDSAFRKLKGEVAQLSGDWTMSKIAHRTLGSGVRQITWVIKEIKRNHGPSDEAIAKCLGLTVEEVQDMRERQLAATTKQTQETIEA